MNEFKEGEYILYRNGDSFEIGKIKRLCADGAFVWYHAGDTAAKTPYDCMHKLVNAYTILDTILGSGTKAVTYDPDAFFEAERYGNVKTMRAVTRLAKGIPLPEEEIYKYLGQTFAQEIIKPEYMTVEVDESNPYFRRWIGTIRLMKSRGKRHEAS